MGPGATLYALPAGIGGTLFALSEGSAGDPNGQGMDFLNNGAPFEPLNPVPANTTTVSSTTVQLAWECQDPEGNTLKYDVFFGNGNGGEIPPLAAGLTAPTLSVSGLEPGVTYYWRVIATDGQAIQEGPLWSFDVSGGGSTSSGEVLFEDFESYTLNQWAEPNWVADANASDGANNYVGSGPAENTSKALRLYGAPGSCWGAITYRPVTFPTRFYLECDVFNSTDIGTGCHPDRGGIGMRNGTSWMNPSRGLLDFLGNGTIRGNGEVLGTYEAGRWHHVKIRYDRQGSQLMLTYWIDGKFLKQIATTIADTGAEDSLDHVEFVAQEYAAWFDNLQIYTHEGRIALVNPDAYRVLKLGALDESLNYYSIASGTVPDGVDVTNAPAWTGTGAHPDFLASILTNAGFRVDVFEAADLPSYTSGVYHAVIVQDPLRQYGQLFPKASETTLPDLLQHSTDSAFLSRASTYLSNGVPLVLVGDAVRLMENGAGRLNLGKTVAALSASHTLDQADSRLPANWLFVRGNPFCGVDRNGSGQYRAIGGPLAAANAVLSDVTMFDGNDIPRILCWSDTGYFPNDSTSLLDATVMGQGDYVLSGAVCDPTVYQDYVNDVVAPLAGFTTANGRRVFFLSSDSFFDYQYRNHQGSWHAGEYQEINNTVSAAGRQMVVSLVKAAMDQAWNTAGEVDTDTDGLPDSWELQRFGSTTNANQFSDTDGDGLSDHFERLAGTDPNDNKSAIGFHEAPSAPTAGQGMVLRWYSITNKVYHVDRSTNLIEGFGTLAPANIPGTPPMNVHTDATANGIGPYFYKIRMDE